ncbi:hypothetical protein [Agarivorans albus]|uniref:hypothetical protein n=1 Tax=Agarivorans albus TaxID=182262 RepID=UPI001BFCF663|nr:hypothetical protein [Agarivorans albus]
MRLTLMLILIISSNPSLAFNSYKLHPLPNERINENAQVNYLYQNTSKGPFRVRIEGLVGHVENYAILKINCAADGGVQVHHNLVSNNNARLNNQQAFPPFNQVFSPKQTNALNNQKSFQLTHASINIGNLSIPASTISLAGFSETYQRVETLCSEQKIASKR